MHLLSTRRFAIRFRSSSPGKVTRSYSGRVGSLASLRFGLLIGQEFHGHGDESTRPAKTR